MASKYNNKKVKADGYTFDSVREYQRYCELKLLLRRKKIKDLEVHPSFWILKPFEVDGVKHRGLKYEGDFSYKRTEDDSFVLEDVKGMETEVFKIKEKLVRAKYGINITKVKMR